MLERNNMSKTCCDSKMRLGFFCDRRTFFFRYPMGPRALGLVWYSVPADVICPRSSCDDRPTPGCEILSRLAMGLASSALRKRADIFFLALGYQVTQIRWS